MTSNATPISAVATGRLTDLFEDDIASSAEALRTAVTGRRILAIGAAGSIGSNTVATLLNFAPQSMHVVDQNENALADLVRHLRARPESLSVPDFRTLPLDYGAQTMRLFLNTQPAYDIILNFAAIKHVRSEKDVFSILQMFDTNLVKQARFLNWLYEIDFAGRYFSVSTDKAANPSSMMGATKRVMEHVIFSARETLSAAITSARFANVAFSNGSLLNSFGDRLARSEPLVAPINTRRYFVSLAESGQICALASVVAPASAIVIPRLDPQEHLLLLETVATSFLRQHGLEPAFYENEDSARASVEAERAKGRWPLLLTPLDTSGEKPYEEFVATGEKTQEIGLPNLLAVTHNPVDPEAITLLLRKAKAAMTQTEKPTRKALREIIALVEPDFLVTHKSSDKHLDQRL